MRGVAGDQCTAATIAFRQEQVHGPVTDMQDLHIQIISSELPYHCCEVGLRRKRAVQAEMLAVILNDDRALVLVGKPIVPGARDRYALEQVLRAKEDLMHPANSAAPL